MKKKLMKMILAASSAILYINPVVLIAESNPCDSDPYSDACKTYSENQKQKVQESSEKAAQAKADAEAQLEEIKARRAEIAADIVAYREEIAGYQAEIDALNTTISELESKISSKQAEINDTQAKADAKQVEIDETQTQISEIGTKVKNRMASSQSGMRINKTFSILMGASTFTEFLRIANGLSDINAYDNETTSQLVTLSSQLKKDKEELDTLSASLQIQKEELDASQQEQESQKAVLEIKQQQIEVFEDAAEDSAAELEAQGEKISSTVSTLQATISANSSKMDELQAAIDKANSPRPDTTTDDSTDGGDSSNTDNNSSSDSNTSSFGQSGWTNPVPSAYRSAGTWNYPGGGKHLGYDFAASEGSTIRAVGDGIVIVSADGATEGYLGSTAHGNGGSSGGGNQIYLLTVVNGSLYAVKYLHMQYGSPIALGTQVKAGDYIGRVGATGNVTGPHCHIEIFYLGDASNFSNYLRTWNGDLAFGCGWAGSYGGYGRRCQDGYGAPCRIRPENVIG